MFSLAEAVLIALLIHFAYTVNCPSGETSQVGSKKLYYHSTQVKWDKAKHSCSNGTDLAIFENNNEFEAMTGVLDRFS